MENVSIHKASDLSPEAKSAIELLLGRAIEADEEISVMALRPHPAPQGPVRQVLARKLESLMDRMADRVKDVPESEVDEILDEAMRSVRPGYVRRK